MKKKLGVLLSGRGSNFHAIYKSTIEGRLNAEIACVITDNPDAPGIEKARNLGLHSYVVTTRGKNKNEYESEMASILEKHDVDIICLAGYMRILGPDFIKKFKERIVNIHPALLPAFPGLHAQKKALDYGVKFSGCTVHFVDEGMDTGPIIAQAVVPVFDDDDEETLSARILEQEHKLYTEALRKVIDNKYVVSGRRVLDKK